MISPILFLIGYILLAFLGGWVGTLVGSACIGFANGMGIPYIISEVSMKLGKRAATTVMPLISAALYLAQFLCPLFLSGVTLIVGDSIKHLPYFIAIILAIIYLLWTSSFLKEQEKG